MIDNKPPPANNVPFDDLGNWPVSNFVETSYFLTGCIDKPLWICRMHFLSKGGPTRVEFDWAFILDHEEKHGNILGYFHTHPQGLTRPSMRDRKTMRAWCDCLGKPLLCVIGVPEMETMEVFPYLFRNYRSLGMKIRFIGHEKGNITFKE